MQRSAQIIVSPVRQAHERRQFLRLPWRIYHNDACWIPPLLLDCQNQLDPRRPYFAHGELALWIACRDGQVVGRIGAQWDELHQSVHGDGAAFFSLLEAENEGDIFAALLGAAETWARNRGATALRGPFNLSINEQAGLLIDGFTTPPMMMMPHAPPYYEQQLRALGYDSVQELWAYRLDARFAPSPAMQALARKFDDSVRLRPLDRRHLERDFSALRSIFNDAWSDNWGFLPFTEAEFSALGREMLLLIRPDCVQIAEVAGEAAGMVVLLPNLHEWIGDLNGRLLPFNVLKLLYRVLRNRATTGRVPLMGIRREYRQNLLGTALAVQLIESLRPAAARMGLEWAELSWILADNAPMNRLIQALGGEVYKRYGIFERQLRVGAA